MCPGLVDEEREVGGDVSRNGTGLPKFGQFSAPGINSLSLVSIWQPLQIPNEKVSGRLKKFSKAFREPSCMRMDWAQPFPAPRTSLQDEIISTPLLVDELGAIKLGPTYPYEKPPQAAIPRNPSSEKPSRIWDMWTSTASKPAAWNANAISAWPLTPCSRKMATGQKDRRVSFC